MNKYGDNMARCPSINTFYRQVFEMKFIFVKTSPKLNG